MNTCREPEDIVTTLNVKMITTLEEFSRLEKDWNGLLASSPADSIFLRWEWLYEWWKAYGEDRALCILLVFRGIDLIGIGPFYTRKNWNGVIPSKKLQFLGTTEEKLISEYMDIIYRRGECEEVTGAIIDHVIKTDLSSDILLQKVVSNSETIATIERKAREGNCLFLKAGEESSPYISLPSDYDEFLKSCSYAMRYKIRSNHRKISKYPEVVFRKTSRGSELQSDIDEFIRLHQLRWKAKQMAGAFSDKEFLEFQRSIMSRLLDKGWLELSFLSVGGRNIAINYNIRYGDKVYFYQAGFDTGFSRNISPGLLLHSFCITEAIKNGVKEYDFLLGNADLYKKRWANGSRQTCDIYLAKPGLTKLAKMAKHAFKELYSSRF